MNYDVDYFIAKFSAIPDERWTIGTAQRHHNLTACAIGHCVPWGRVEMWRELNSEPRQLAAILFGSSSDDNVSRITSINDGRLIEYPQPTPKARILAALRDVKARAEAALEAYELRELQLTPAKEQVSA